MGRRDEEKKRRRRKRLAERQAHQRPASLGGPEEIQRLVRSLEHLKDIPDPATWPGAVDPSLARPDGVKYDLAIFATENEPGRSKLHQLEDRLRKGLLADMPEMDHWAIEAFLWEGLPGDDWHPIDAYLAHAGTRFPPAAADQLRLWKQAQLGLYEIGPVADDLITLFEWDGRSRRGATKSLRAISLAIRGVNSFRDQAGHVMLTYLAPWRPDAGIHCAMGYGPLLPQNKASVLLPFLGLRQLEAAMRPLPWKESPQKHRDYLSAWRGRDWEAWFRRELTFPFQAYVTMPPDGHPEVRPINEVVPSPGGDSRRFGVYFMAGVVDGQGMLAGGTGVTPVDLSSPNARAFAEYHAYRKIAGPPPGMVGMPTFLDL